MIADHSLARIVFKLEKQHWRPGTATLCLLGVALPVLLSVWAGHTAWGVLSGVGAIYTGFASFGGVQQARVRRMLATSLSTSAFTLVGSLIGPSDVATIVVIGIAVFILALIGSRSVEANTVVVQTIAVLIVLSGLAHMNQNPLGNAGLVLAGGLTQTILLSLAGPVYRHYEERKAVAEAYQTLAKFSNSLLHLPPNSETIWMIPDAHPFQEARNRIEESESFGNTTEVVPLRHLMNGAETLRAALVGFARAYSAERSIGVLERAWVESVAERLVAAFSHIADAVSTGHYQPKIAVHIEHDGVPASEHRHDLIRWMLLFNRTFADIAEGPPAHLWENASTQKRSILSGWFRFFKELFDTQSLQKLAINHALRYTVTITLSVAAYRLLHLDHGYWFPLTIAIVMRGDYGTTLVRGLGRLAGTFGAVVVATSIDIFGHPSLGVLVALILIATWVSYASFQASYSIYSFALTLFVVFALTAVGTTDGPIGLPRLVATSLGIAATIAASWLWPIWQSGNVRTVLQDAFRYQLDYANALREALHGGSLADADAARHRGRALRLEAERLVQAAHLEPRWSHRERLKGSPELLARLDENAALFLAIHAQVLDERSGRPCIEQEIEADLVRAEEVARQFAEVA